MKDIVHLAQAWQEHCRDTADEAFQNGHVTMGEDYQQQADEAERIIKNYIDTLR